MPSLLRRRSPPDAFARAALFYIAAGPGVAFAAANLTELPIEKLLALPVYSASKLAQNTTSAPAAATVITGEDFRTYGYRTIGDALRSVRGMFVHSDRNYVYLGGRGFGRIGDYNSRFLVLIDGHRTNATIYDEAFIGEEGLVDVDLIERMEVVQGPGSSAYGGNAFLGVINIVTRPAADLVGGEVSLEAGSGHRRKGRLTAGRQFANGASLLVSGSLLDSPGRTLRFPDFDAPATNNGVARGIDFEDARSAFAKFEWAGLTVTLAKSERTKGIGFGQWGTVFNDPENRTRDDNSYLSAIYRRGLSSGGDLTARLSWSRYEYGAVQIYVPPPIARNRSLGLGEWWNGELNWTLRPSDGHRVLVGVEYQWNRRQLQRETDEAPSSLIFEDSRSSRRYAAFVQDEYTLAPNAVLHAGLRLDRSGRFAPVGSPRLGLVMKPAQPTTVKLISSSAFRAPSVYELYYAYPGSNAANPALKPERIRQVEGILEQELRADMRATASLYHYQIRRLINAVADPSTGLTSFQNVSSVRGRGLELGLERAWAGGSNVRASLALQSARDNTGAAITNSPGSLAKLNWQTARFFEQVRAGFEVQSTGSRRTQAGRTGRHTLANLNVVWTDPSLGTEASLAIYNLTDRRYADPVAFDPGTPARDTIQQDRRALRLKIVQPF